MSAVRSLRERARVYLLLGWAIIVVPFMSKNPGYAGWQTTRMTDAELEQAFPDGLKLNIGVLLGEPSRGLADVDLDTWLAILLAERFLPATKAIFGRATARRSHRFYRIVGALKSTVWRDPTSTKNEERATLLEIRFSGQTLLPGSTHPNGEAIEWDEEGDVAEVTTEQLLRDCGRLASAVLLARYWPAPGKRHAAALALAGGLLRAKWSLNDVTKFISAVATGASDDEAEDRVKAALSSKETLDADQKATGWPTLAKLIDPRVVDAVLKWLGIQTDGGNSSNSSYEEFDRDSDGLEAAVRAISVPPFPIHVFPPRIRAFIERGAQSVGCPPDLVAVAFLSYASSAIGKTRIIRVKHKWQHLPTLWTGTVAASGDGKTPADSYARSVLDELQSSADERFQEQLVRYKIELARWKTADPDSRGEEPPPPTYEHWFSTDATVESLAPMLQHNVGIALACDELVGWARGCNAYKKGGNDRQKYLEIWNGRSLKVDRKTQGVIFVKEPVLCIAGGIQPSRLHELVREASAHDGLVQRFLWSYQNVTPADWNWEDREIDDLEWMVPLFQVLRRSPNPLGQLVLRPDPDARVLWKEWYDDLLVTRKVLPPLAREFASKYPAQLARIWLVLSALWEPQAIHGIASVSRLLDAIAVVDYFNAHARRVMMHFGTAALPSESGMISRVRLILERAVVEHADRDGWISRTEIWEGLNRNGKSYELDAALTSLESAGVAESREVPTGTKLRTEYRLIVENSSYEFYEEFDPEDVEEASEPNNSYSSYEQFAMHLRPESRECYACHTTNRASDGVCLTCHPRPWSTKSEDGR